MIRGTHVILYSTDPAADRAVLQKLLGPKQVDAGGGWLIQALPPAEVAVHPADVAGAAELYLVCDDVDATLADLAALDISVEGPVSDQRWGRVAFLALPGGGRLGIYEARHPTAFDL